MLMNSGIDFTLLKRTGITFESFSEYIITSGLILNEEVTWISFHGIYDFAYLLRVVTNKVLPESEEEFFEELKLYFNKFYDIRHLIRENVNLKGSLQKLSCILNVDRIGNMHQAGSDSKVTSDCFYKLKECEIFIDWENDCNTLFGFEKTKIDVKVKYKPLCEIEYYKVLQLC